MCKSYWNKHDSKKLRKEKYTIASPRHFKYQDTRILELKGNLINTVRPGP